MENTFIEMMGIFYIWMGAFVVIRAYIKFKKSQDENPLAIFNQGHRNK